MTGLWLPAMKPKPWVGWRWMVTCRAEAGLRVPLSIPSWLSSNIAVLYRTQIFRHKKGQVHTETVMNVHFVLRKTSAKRAPCTCVRSCVHPGPWPSPERTGQHGTGLHCKGCFLFGNHSPAQKKGNKRGWGNVRNWNKMFPGLTAAKILFCCCCFLMCWVYLSTSWNTATGKNKIINVKLKNVTLKITIPDIFNSWQVAFGFG